MIQIKVKNFGPIKNGYSEKNGFMEIKPVTFFVGNQATGKSTIAKLVSLFMWLEKAFVKGIYDPKFFEQKDFFYLLSNNKIDSYISQDSVLEYVGTICRFSYKNGKFDEPLFVSKKLMHYKRPKIMYVPAERNILSVMPFSDFEDMNYFSEMLRVFHARYKNALGLSDKSDFNLPVSNIVVHYNKNIDRLFVSSRDDKYIPIEQSSSGIQSVAPLSIVSNYLSDFVKTDLFSKMKALKIKDQKSMVDAIRSYTDDELLLESIEDTVKNLLNSGKDNSDENLAVLPIIRKKFLYFFNTCFLNVVEEPELNLFPASQSSVLHELLKCYNKSSGNRLVLTTHSPYFISELSLCIKSFDLKKKGVPVRELCNIVPETSYVCGDDCIVYETHENGEIKQLKTYGSGIPSDDNMLNMYLEMSNKRYDRLLDLQEKYL